MCTVEHSNNLTAWSSPMSCGAQTANKIVLPKSLVSAVLHCVQNSGTCRHRSRNLSPIRRNTKRSERGFPWTSVRSSRDLPSPVDRHDPSSVSSELAIIAVSTTMEGCAFFGGIERGMNAQARVISRSGFRLTCRNGKYCLRGLYLRGNIALIARG
jgi:hypothetical protein